jgi:ubiquinone/menaquinone biosynthesis C-methylase UbiE
MQKRTLLFTLALTFSAVLPAGAEDAFEREPAPVMSYHGADWLERSERAEEERPEEVIATMGLAPGDMVADIGCGTGYFSRRFARAVAPEGVVYGVDIQPPFLRMLKKYADEAGLDNVVPVLGETADPKLDPESIDWMFLADVYHEFQEPEPMLAKMRAALKPTGRVALLEYRLNGDTSLHIKENHRMSVPQVMKEWRAAGFVLVELHEFLPHQHFFVFRKTLPGEAPEQ